MSAWIAVETRLPTKSGKYKVKMMVGSKEQETNCGGLMTDFYGFRWYVGDHERVTHWEPTPPQRDE